MTESRSGVVRACYAAYESGNRDVVERFMGENLRFYSPADPGVDRATYFDRCWPNSQRIGSFELTRLVEVGDEVFVTYEATRADATRFRNTEVLTFADDQIVRIEVYFGWELTGG